MGLETYTGYIPALNVANPEGTDGKDQGDDHLRGIKKTLADTFVGFTEEDVGVTVKASDINAVCTGGVASRVPAGAISAFGSPFPPEGWLICDGQTVSRTEYADLFAVIQTVWGAGDGSTTFKLPDFRGQFLRGWSNTNTQYDEGRGFATQQASNNKIHEHTVDTFSHGHTAVEESDHTHPYTRLANTAFALSGGSANTFGTTSSNSTTGKGSAHTHVIQPEEISGVKTNGIGNADEARPHNYAIQYIIKT